MSARTELLAELRRGQYRGRNVLYVTQNGRGVLWTDEIYTTHCGFCSYSKKCGRKVLDRKYPNWIADGERMKADFLKKEGVTVLDQTIEEKCAF